MLLVDAGRSSAQARSLPLVPLDPIDLLLEELVTTGRGKWPTPRELRATRAVATWRAFLESDRDRLRDIAGWDNRDRPYKVDPLPELIADAWADHLFDEDLTIVEAASSDKGALEALLEGNPDFNGDIHEAERRVVGLGEEWWRAFIDRELADVPLLEWHSRDEVVPYYIGRRLIAAAVVTELPRKPGTRSAVFRHFEIHAAGVVEHVLFRGTNGTIGRTVPLEDHPDLEDLADELGAEGGQGQRWEHGLPMLMGRITNGRRIDKKLRVGISDFKRITDQLLDLNEAVTIAGENVRLTAKKRVIVPEDTLRSTGAPGAGDLEDRGDGTFNPVPGRGYGFDASEDVFVVSKLDGELGKGNDGPYKVLEYSFDALPLLAHKADVVQTALTRVGLTPQYVGVADEQPGVLSGTAYRLKLIPTTKAGKGKGRPWDDTLPHILSLLARLDELPEADGGFGRRWADAVTPPSVERSPGLPADEVEDANVESTLVGAGVRSKYTSIKRQHPDWDEAAILDELDKIKGDAPSSGLAAGADDDLA